MINYYCDICKNKIEDKKEPSSVFVGKNKIGYTAYQNRFEHICEECKKSILKHIEKLRCHER